MLKSIWVKFQKEGIHRYPEALTESRLKDVDFLGYPHRHIFHFFVEVSVSHNNREIEFILFKRELESLFSDKVIDIDFKSCEMLAEEIVSWILDKYQSLKYVKVSVSEDNENGASVVWNNDLFNTN